MTNTMHSKLLPTVSKKTGLAVKKQKPKTVENIIKNIRIAKRNDT